ncbi:MAG: hypothetical protein A3F73_02785 [Gallionellales bacterium RIFCSPLOWO2_12_FULL_59_22]|nr:MAG: hypothetical protein A3H99_07740 [Gallionellales bacterium RIFCSPLOWO2_02_FULL_59_110]OGT13350.1 MAG: hypothetical protein A3F73_02785 [Gallionellales bacterium RIFCSPLOWO2_12_FULL_59_22]
MNDGEIGTGILHAGTHLVIVQGNVKTPMNAVSYFPVRTHRISQNGRIRHEVANIEPPFKTGHPVDCAFCLNHTKRS